MAASYPNSVKQWTDKQDIIDDVFAGDINSAYHEIIAVENELIKNVHKQPVRAATTGNITLSGEQALDNISVVAGDRVLVKDQTIASENGIYIVAAGAWSRATDANTDTKVKTGMSVYVCEGSINAGHIWILVTTGNIVIGTTSLNFSNKLNAHLAETMYYTTQKLNADSEGIYTEVQHKRADGTLILKSVLSGGTPLQYTTRTVTKYATDGVTVEWTKTYTITYDANGNVESEVLA